MEEKTTYYEKLINKLDEEFWDNFKYAGDRNENNTILLMEVVKDLLYELDEKEREGK